MQGLRLKIFVSFTGGNGLPPRVLGVVDINHHCRDYHYAKIAQIRSFVRSLFSCIWTEYGEIGVFLRIQSECGKIRTRKNSVFVIIAFLCVFLFLAG